MLNSPVASIIISFYNKIDFLRLVLAGFERQSVKDFELIIADDGSKKEIVDEISQIKKSYSFGIHHVWHEDNGWQKNKILNKATLHASAPYLIFVDGDCVPHRHFVADHLRLKEEGVVIGGRRVNLNSKICTRLTEQNVLKGFLEKSFPLQLFYQLTDTLQNVLWGLHITHPFLRRFVRYHRQGIKGCNFSIHKKDLLDVNGFDERYLHPTIGEDDDLNYRLLLAGKSVRIEVCMLIQYHLFHSPLSRDNETNRKIFEKVKERCVAFTPYGIVQQ